MPQPFSNLHHISIVTDDIDAMEKFYSSIGVGPFVQYPPLKEYVHLDAPDEEGFYQLTIRCAQIGPVQLQLIQPGRGDSLYKQHLEKHGPGVYHLGFAVNDLTQARAEVRELGLKEKSSGVRDNGSGFAYLDTEKEAGVTLLVRQSPPEK